MGWIMDDDNPDFEYLRVPPFVDFMSSPCGVLQAGNQGLGVFLVQTALCNLGGGSTGFLYNPEADVRIFPASRTGPAAFSASGLSLAMCPLLAGSLGSALTATPGCPGLAQTWMPMLQKSPLAYCYCIRGILGSYLRAGNSQAALGITPHGTFCPMTETAVRAFQQRSGLDVSGCVDPLTWQRLFPRCKLRLRLSPPVLSPAPGQAQTQATAAGGAAKGNSSNKNDNASSSSSKPANTPSTPAADDDDKNNELALGINSDGTLSLEYQRTFSEKKLGSWLLSDGVNLKQGLSGEYHQPYSTWQGRNLNFKYQLTLEDSMKFWGGRFTVDGFAEGAVQVPLDKGTPGNDNNATVALHLGVDLNANLPKITGVKWLPKIVVEGTGGPETEIKSAKPSGWETKFKAGGELKAVWEF